MIPTGDKVPKFFTTKLCGGPLDGHYVQWNEGQRDAVFRHGAGLVMYSVCGGYDLAFYAHPDQVFREPQKITPITILSDAIEHFRLKSNEANGHAHREDLSGDTRYNAGARSALWNAAAQHLYEAMAKLVK